MRYKVSGGVSHDSTIWSSCFKEEITDEIKLARERF